MNDTVTRDMLVTWLDLVRRGLSKHLSIQQVNQEVTFVRSWQNNVSNNSFTCIISRKQEAGISSVAENKLEGPGKRNSILELFDLYYSVIVWAFSLIYKGSKLLHLISHCISSYQIAIIVCVWIILSLACMCKLGYCY